MLDKKLWNPLLSVDRDDGILYIAESYHMTVEEATKEYGEYRKKYMNSWSFFKECEEGKQSKSIERTASRNNECQYVTEEEVAEMYKSGMSFGEITSETGRSFNWIKKALDMYGVPVRAARRERSILDPYRDDVINLLRKGTSITNISKILDVNVKTVTAFIRKKGLRECI